MNYKSFALWFALVFIAGFSPLTISSTILLESTTSIDVKDKSHLVAEQDPTTKKLEKLETCEGDFIPEYFSNINYAEFKRFIEDRFKNLDASGFSKEQLDYFSVFSGYGLGKGREIYNVDLVDFSIPTYSHRKTELASFLQSEAVLEGIRLSDKSMILQALEAHNASKSVHYNTEGGLKYLLSLVLSSKIQDKTSFANKLISIGVEVNYPDVLQAMSSGQPLQLVKDLMKNSDLRADHTFYDPVHLRYSSLSLEALKLGQMEYANYWIDQGSPVQPDLFNINALDIIAGYIKYEDRQFDPALILKIAKNGAYPISDGSVNIISKLFVDPEISNAISRSLKQKETKYRAFRKAAKSKIEELHDSLISLTSPHQDGDLGFTTECIQKLGFELAKNAGLFNSERERNIAHSDVQHQKKNESISFENEFLLTDTEESLAPYQNFQEKQKVERYLTLKFEKKITELEKSGELKKVLTEDVRKLLERISTLAKKGFWDDVIYEAADYDRIDKSDMMTMLIRLSLEYDAPIKVFDFLFESGGKLMEGSIEILIANNNLGLANYLLSFGLDVNYKSPLGQSSVMTSVKLRKIEMLRFLLENGATTDSRSFGFDALDIALLQYSPKNDGTVYIELLLKYGYEIEASHRQIVNSWLSEDLDKYLKLIHKYPNFND